MLQHTFSEVTVKCFFNLHIRWVTEVNPLSANSDHQQFSPNNIHTLSRDKVMRINKMITIEKMLWSFIKFSQLIVKGDVWRSVWRICMWILGLKGLIRKKSPFARKSKKIWKSWIPIPGTGFLVLCQWNLDFGYQSLVGGRILDSKGQDSRLHQQNFRILHSKCKNFPDFAIRNSLTGGEKKVLRDR